MLRAEQVSLPGSAGKQRLTAVDVDINVGEFIAVVGPSGAGKTSLLQVVLGLEQPEHGAVTWQGVDVRRLTHRERAAAFAWLPQSGILPEPVPAIEYVAAARFRFGEPWRRARALAAQSMEAMGAGAFRTHLLSELSGGELQRVSLAALAAQEAQMMLLDEPANHLDPTITQALFTELASWAIQGTGVVCVSHDINTLAQPARLLAEAGQSLRVVGMSAGRKCFDLDYHDDTLAAALAQTFALECEAHSHSGRRWFVFG